MVLVLVLVVVVVEEEEEKEEDEEEEVTGLIGGAKGTGLAGRPSTSESTLWLSKRRDECVLL